MTVLNRTVRGDVHELVVDADPSIGAGEAAPIGSTATLSDGTAKWIKVGAPDADWNEELTEDSFDIVPGAIGHLGSVEGAGYVGNQTYAALEAMGAGGPGVGTAGYSYFLTTGGTLTAGSLAVIAGDHAMWDGTGWIKTQDASAGGFPSGPGDSDITLMAHPTATLIAPLTDGDDNGKLIKFDGTSFTPVSKQESYAIHAMTNTTLRGVEPNFGYGVRFSGSSLQRVVDLAPSCYSSGSAGTEIDNSDTKDVSKQVKIPGNTLAQGDSFDLSAAFATTQSAGATSDVVCSLEMEYDGGSHQFEASAPATDPATGALTGLSGIIYVRTAGAAGVLVTDKGAVITGVDMTKPITFTGYVDWTNAVAGRAARCEGLAIYRQGGGI